MKELEELIGAITTYIVDKQEEVQIKTVEGEQTYIIELKVAKDDTGKIIGKDGRTVTAIRTLLNAIGNKIKKKIVLEIVE